jgi:hypothetical protein
VPSRHDLYDGIQKMLGAAGFQTRIRGYYYPEENSMPGLAFPIASYFEDTPERMENFEPAGNQMDGSITIWMFIETGSVVSDAMGGGADTYRVIDDMHDAVLRQMFNNYFDYFSQTTSVYAEQFEIWYWYESKNLPIVAGSMRLHYTMNFA